MGPDARPELHRDRLASPFAQPLAQQASPSLWSAHSAQLAAPHPTSAHAPSSAAASAHGSDVLSSHWDGAKRAASSSYHGLTAWNFEGRDAHSGKAPTQAELDKDPAWRRMAAKESIANHRSSAKDGMGELSPAGSGRNLGHMALDVVPHWLGSTARGEEGTSFAAHALGPESYKQAGEGWDGVKSGVGDQLSRVGRRVSAGWDGLSSWAGAQSAAVAPPHDR